jgi:hypothetical protein
MHSIIFFAEKVNSLMDNYQCGRACVHVCFILAPVMQAERTQREKLERDNIALRSQLNSLTEQLQGRSNTSQTPETTASPWVMSGSSGQSTGGEAPFSGIGMSGDTRNKMMALRSGESVDARSQKSDNLTGDEMETLGGAQPQKGFGSTSPAGSSRESPIKPQAGPKRNAGDVSQRLSR